MKSQISLLPSLSDSSGPSNSLHANCNTAEKEMGWCSCWEAGGKERKREKRMKQWITVTGELIHAGFPAAMFCSLLLVWFSKHYSEASVPTCHGSAESVAFLVMFHLETRFSTWDYNQMFWEGKQTDFSLSFFLLWKSISRFIREYLQVYLYIYISSYFPSFWMRKHSIPCLRKTIAKGHIIHSSS